MTLSRCSVALGAAALLGSLGSSGCVPKLTIPDGAVLSCADSGDCPDGYTCRLSEARCVRLDANLRPTVTVALVPPTRTSVTVRLTVVDNESDPVGWRGEILVPDAGGGAPTPMTVSLTPSVATGSPEGTELTASVDTAALPATYVQGLVLRLTPSDAGGDGASRDSPPFDFGNDAPVAGNFSLTPEPARGVVVLSFGVTDSAADPVDVVEFRVALDGNLDAASGATSLDLTAAAAGDVSGLLPGGSLTEIAANPTAATSSFVLWDTLYWPDTRVSADGVRARVTMRDSYGAEATVDSAPFSLRNQSAPRLEGVRVAGVERGRGTGALAITYRLVDEQSEPADVRLEYSADQGEHWGPCREFPEPASEGRYDSATAPSQAAGDSGMPHAFFWDVVANLFGNSGPVWLRLTAADAGGAGPTVVFPLASPVGVPQPIQSLVTPFDAAVGLMPRSLGAADFTGDKRADLVVGGTSPTAALVVFPGADCAGAWINCFAAASGCDEKQVWQLVTGDFDGDAAPDVVYLQSAMAATTGELRLRLSGNAAAPDCGPLRPAVALGLPHVFDRLAAADLDSDGDLDLALTWYQSLTPRAAQLRTYRNDGAGTLTLAAQVDLLAAGMPNPEITDVAAGDLDGDGVTDLVFGTVDAGPFWCRGDGVGGCAVVQSLAGLKGATRLAVADLDRDGYADVVAAGGGKLYLLSGRDTAAFRPTDGTPPRPTQTYLQSGFPSRVVVADVDADGLEDVVVIDDSGVERPVSLWRGEPGGQTLAPAVSFFMSGTPHPRDVLLLDADRDGGLDYVTADAPGAQVLSTSGTVPPGQGVVTQQRFSPTDFTVAEVVPLDVDRDGVVDLLGNDQGGARLVLWRGRGGDGVGEGELDVTASFPLTSSLLAIRPCDLDGDGQLDLVGLNPTPPASLAWYPDIGAQLRAGTLVATPVPGAGAMAFTFACGDLDGDGAEDVLVGSGGVPGGVALLNKLSQGGGFEAHANDLDASSYFVLGDVSNDGRADVLWTGPIGAYGFRVGNGDGTFAADSAPACDMSGSHSNGRGATFVDADGDGDLDVVVSYNVGGPEVCYGINDGAGGLTSWYTTFLGPTALVGVDLNGDGLEDVIGPGTGGGGHVFLGTGQPPGSAPPVAAGWDNAAVMVDPPSLGDLDGDGLPDVVGRSDAGGVLGLGIQRYARTDARRRFSESLDARAPLAGVVQTVGADLLPNGIDRFGQPRLSSVGRRPLAQPRRLFEPARALWSLLANPQPLTAAWELTGEVRFTHVADASGVAPVVTRLRAEPRFGPVSAGVAAGLGLPGRGFIVDLPIQPWIATVNAPKVRVILAHTEWRRAAADPADPLYDPGAAAGSPALALLPRTGATPANRLVPTVTYEALSHDPDDDLSNANGTGRRYAIDLTAGRRRIRVLTDALGDVQAFLVP